MIHKPATSSSKIAYGAAMKDDEELQLEQQLFGSRKKRKIGGKGINGFNGSVKSKVEEDTGLADVTDQAVRLCFSSEHAYAPS